MKMNWLTCLSLFAAASITAGCTRVRVGEHLAATDYAGTPQRMFIINGMDTNFDPQLPEGFATSIVAALASCQVSAEVYRPDMMQLDAEAKLVAQWTRFKADTVLNIRQTNRGLVNGDVRSGSYLFSIRDVGQKRDIWKGRIGVGSSSSLLTDRSVVGGKVAEQLIRQLVTDKVLKTCPELPAQT